MNETYQLESSILSSLIVSPILWESIESIVLPEYFYSLRKPFNLIYNRLINGEEINYKLLIHEFVENKISWRAEPSVEKKWIVDYAKRLQKIYTRNQLEQLSFDFASTKDQDNERRLSFLKQAIDQIETQGFKAEDTRIVTRNLSIQYIREGVHLIPSPWENFNNKYGGWLRGSITGIGGVPGTGKTTIMRQAAFHIAQKGIPVAIFTLETNKEKLNLYFAASLLGIPGVKIFKNQLTPIEKDQIIAKLHYVEKLPMYIYDVTDFGTDTLDIDLQIRRDVRRFGLQAIFIDYLQIMNFDKLTEEQAKIVAILPVMKTLVLQTNIALVIFIQLKKDVKDRANPKPNAGDYRGSAVILDAVDMPMAIFRPEIHKIEFDKEGIPTKGKMWVIPFKNKYLETLEEVVLGYNVDTGDYVSLEDEESFDMEDPTDDIFGIK